MRQALSISALARSTGVTSKTLRHWERVGLLPKAARTHTGYRVNYSRVRKDPDFTNCLLESENGDHLRPKPTPEPKRTKEDAELEALLQEIESRG